MEQSSSYSSASTSPRTGWMYICAPLAKPSPSPARRRPAALASACGRSPGAGRARGDRRLRGDRRGRARRGRAAAGGGQPPPDPRLRPRHRPARQDRPAGCRGDRPLRRSHAAAEPRPLPDAAARPSANWSPAAGSSIEMIGGRAQPPPPARSDRAGPRASSASRLLQESSPDRDRSRRRGRASPAWRADEDLLRSRARHRPDHRPHPDRRAARARPADPPQIAGLVGVAPFNRDSGTWRGRRTIAGRPRRRSARPSTWPTLVAIRRNPAIAAIYQRLRGRRQTGQGRHHRLHAQAAHHPQRHPERPKPWQPA